MSVAKYILNSVLPLIVVDSNNIIVEANKSFCEIIGYCENELIKKNISFISGVKEDIIQSLFIENKTNQKVFVKIFKTSIEKGNKKFYDIFHFLPSQYSSDSFASFVDNNIFLNIFSKLEQENTLLLYVNINILNKTYLYYDLSVRANVKKYILSVLDNEIKKYVPEFLLTEIDKENFLIMSLKNFKDNEENRQKIVFLAKNLIQTLQEINAANNEEKISFHADIKIVTKILHAENQTHINTKEYFNNFLARVDKRIKTQIKNSYLFLEKEIIQNLRGKLAIEKRLLKLFSDPKKEKLNQELFFAYQPQFNMQTMDIVGVELLVRWQYEKNIILYPVDFLSIIEKIDKTQELTLLAVENICHFFKTNPAFKKTIFFNIYPKDLEDQNLMCEIYKVIEKHGIEPNLIGVEILEETISSNLDCTLDAIKKLHEFGIKIAIDDFGQGSTSLRILRTLPIDFLKIDKIFVKNLHIKKNKDILKNLLRIVENTDIKTIIEGIEDEETLSYLREQNGEFGQGYFFSKPIPQKLFVENHQQYMI